MMRAQEYQTVSTVDKTAPPRSKRITSPMESARKKGDSARKTFASLGIGMGALAKGDTQEVIKQVADSFKSMTNPAQRAAAAQKLFGRSWQPLLALLMSGREGIQENLDMQKRYGNVLGGKSVADTRKLIHAQHEMEAAVGGLKVTLGTALLPVIGDVVEMILKLVRVFQPFIRSGKVMKITIGLLVVAFAAYKIAIVAATIASWGLEAATWAWIGVGVLIVAAIIAIAVGFYYLYKRCTWFRNAVNAVWAAIKVGARATWDFLKQVWSWIKAYWPYLLGALGGPFALAAVVIIKHFKEIKAFIAGVIAWVKRAFNGLVDFVKGLPARLGGGVLGKLTSIAGKVGSVGKHIPLVGGLLGRAAGGPVPRQSNVLVGERGPEILSLPHGGYVTPIPNPAQLDVGGAFGTAHITRKRLDRRARQAITYYAPTDRR
jgi:hypothetical protein